MMFLLSDVLLASDRIDAAGYEVERVTLHKKETGVCLLELHVEESDDIVSIYVLDREVELEHGSEFHVMFEDVTGDCADEFKGSEHWVSCMAYVPVTPEVVCIRRGLR